MQKKRVAKELLSTFKDESIIVLADWLKVRGSLKSWTKLWCVLKPGLLILYKSQKVKSSHWIGTIILSTCELIERPSKKDGFCFKLFHTMDQSIWASRGPEVRFVRQKLNFVTFSSPLHVLVETGLDWGVIYISLTGRDYGSRGAAPAHLSSHIPSPY